MISSLFLAVPIQVLSLAESLNQILLSAIAESAWALIRLLPRNRQNRAQQIKWFAVSKSKLYFEQYFMCNITHTTIWLYNYTIISADFLPFHIFYGTNGDETQTAQQDILGRGNQGFCINFFQR